MSTSNNSVEVSAATIDDAVRKALEELGASENEVVIEIITTPRSGILGLGARPAKIRVSRRDHLLETRRETTTGSAAPSPQEKEQSAREEARDLNPPAPEPAAIAPPQLTPEDLQEQARQATALVSELLSLMGETAKINVSTHAGDDGSESPVIEMALEGDGSGVLIGRHGQTLDALEYLVNRIFTRKVENAAAVLIDAESYRTRRYQQLERMALSMGERVKREHRTLRLRPMPPRERRRIHLALKDDPLVVVRSTGSGHLRPMQISPAKEQLGTESEHSETGGKPRNASRKQTGGSRSRTN